MSDVSTLTSAHIRSPKNKIQEPHEPAAHMPEGEQGTVNVQVQKKAGHLGWSSCLHVKGMKTG